MTKTKTTKTPTCSRCSRRNTHGADCRNAIACKRRKRAAR